MSWQDFDVDSALQRDTLGRALPLVETESAEDWGDRINMADPHDPGPHHGARRLNRERSDARVVHRPPAAATAPVRDSMDGPRPPARGGAHGRGRCWQALTLTYSKTVELRHSLVHRAVFVDPATQALVGHDRQGSRLSPVTVTEQEAFVRAVLRASQLVTSAIPDERYEDDLVYQVGLLGRVHQVALPRLPAKLRLARMTVTIPADPGAPGQYLLDVPAVKAQSSQPDAQWTDLIVQFHDRPGQELQGRLEHAPSQLVSINPWAPPSWLC